MNIVILAAGMGKRMHSSIPKVLHLLAGKPLLEHVVAAARALDPEKLVVVYGHGGELVQQRITSPDLAFVKQEPQMGTGHAVMQALPELDESVPTLILYGDVPLIGVSSLARLVSLAGGNKLGILTVEMQNPAGYGRIIRENGKISRIVEQKDGNEKELAVTEINTGIMAVPTVPLKRLPTKSKSYRLNRIISGKQWVSTTRNSLPNWNGFIRTMWLLPFWKRVSASPIRHVSMCEVP